MSKVTVTEYLVPKPMSSLRILVPRVGKAKNHWYRTMFPFVLCAVEKTIET